MIEQSVSLASNGVVKVPGYEQLVRWATPRTGACTNSTSPHPASGMA